jgi:two-component sensor histidine kinase
MFKNSESRVRSMALVHEKLYESADLAQIDIRDYLESLITHLQHSYSLTERVSLSVAADSVPLHIDVVIPCALIVNELVSNAFEHAFPDGRSGQVRVEARKSPHGTLRLSVSDTGAGLPPGAETEHAETLGLRLVSALAEQLSARLTIDRPAEGGTVFLIEFAPPHRWPGGRAPQGSRPALHSPVLQITQGMTLCGAIR